MRFLERFSINTSHPDSISRQEKKVSRPGQFSRWVGGSRFRHIRDAGEIGKALKRGFAMLDDESQTEIRAWIVSQQTTAGGFPDRAGKCDLYYTLFGFFLVEASDVDKVLPMVKDYVKRVAQNPNHSGIDLFCLAILHASLFPVDPLTKKFAGKIRKIREDEEMLQNGYSRFLMILSLLYLRDYSGAWHVLKTAGNSASVNGSAEIATSKPCPVVAAEQILVFMESGMKGCTPARIMSFYRENGGFAAFTDAPAPDLLSTAVALFSLRFIGYDLRLIRPGCLGFISELFHEGGFRAVAHDKEVDVEYTFYGLLALGALNDM